MLCLPGISAGRGDLLEMETLEAKSYLIPFDPVLRPVFWFNDEFPPQTWSKLHSHPHWGELAYSGRGCIVMCTEQGNYLAPPQRAVWVPAGVPHEWYVPCTTRDCSLWIDVRALCGVARFARVHVMEITPLVREIILHLASLPYPYGDEACGRLVGALLDLVPELPEVPEPLAMPRDHRLVELCTALLTEPGSAATLSQWAQRLGMSERNLARLFLRETGSTFRTWRLRRRMQAAYDRLKQGESVTSVALESGYSSLSAFIGAFKRLFERTPGSLSGARRRKQEKS